jgi:hypothetical protein
VNPAVWFAESLPLWWDLAWVPPILLSVAIAGLLTAAARLALR